MKHTKPPRSQIVAGSWISLLGIYKTYFSTDSLSKDIVICIVHTVCIDVK